MTAIEISTTSPFDALRRTDGQGEFWSGRDLVRPLGYGADWRNFADAVARAIAAATNAGHQASDHFGDATKMVRIGSGAERAVTDFRLTRFGAYLVAMNGDPRKSEIAAAQTYFATKTREAELSQHNLPQTRVEALRELVATLEELDAARQELEAAKPAAEAWALLASADGDYAVADAAKILSRDPAIKLGRDRLFTLLLDWRWIYRQEIDGRPRVMQTTVETGRMSEIPQSHYHPRTGELVLDPPQVRITVKGIEAIRKRLAPPANLAVAS